MKRKTPAQRSIFTTNGVSLQFRQLFLAFFICIHSSFLAGMSRAQDGDAPVTTGGGDRYNLAEDKYGIFPLTVEIKPGQAAHFLVNLPPRTGRWTDWQVLMDTRGFSNDQTYIDGGKLAGTPGVEGQIKKMPIAGTYVPYLILTGPGGSTVIRRTTEIRVRETFWGDYFNHTSGVFSNPLWATVLIIVVAALLGAFASLASSVVTSLLNERQRRQNVIRDDKNRKEDDHKRRQKGLRLHLQKLILRIKEDVNMGTAEGVSFTEWAGEANDPHWNYLLYEQPASDIVKRTKETYMYWQLNKTSAENYELLKHEILNQLDDEFLNIVEIP